MEEYKIEEIKDLLEECNIKLMNCKSLGKMFWRYIPYSRLKDMLDRKELAFIYPELWDDPYEKLFLKTNYKGLGGYSQKKVYCLCGRGNGNEDASWKVYSNGYEPTICVRFNLKKLFPLIRAYLGSNYNIYYSSVCYDTTSKIRNIPNNNLRAKYLPNPFVEEDYVKLMSLKRQSFAYEKERRIFIVPKRIYRTQGDILMIPIEYDIFELFTLEPMETINTCKLILQDKADVYKYWYEKIHRFIEEKIGVNAKLYKSSLYRYVKPIKHV